jgi:hypothetical protein
MLPMTVTVPGLSLRKRSSLLLTVTAKMSLFVSLSKIRSVADC